MKNIAVAIFMAMALSACNFGTEKVQQKRQGNEWKPGLGETMSGIQQHHAKLYYSAKAQNWALARYELGEIKEGLEAAEARYPEIKVAETSLSALAPAIMKDKIEHVAQAIEGENPDVFMSSYEKLTSACNNCHRTANRGVVVIQSPTDMEFTNQKF